MNLTPLPRAELELSGRCGVSIDNLRELAEKELRRPRDVIHAEWAQVFLEHVKEYA